MRVCVKEEKDNVPSVPPGFESYASLTLTPVHDGIEQESDNAPCYSASGSSSEARADQKKTELNACGTKIKRCLRRKPGINFGLYEYTSEDESDSLKHEQNINFRPSLPKGVIRGCPQCKDCQKITSRWRPESACRPDLEDAPVFYPTEEEFEDTLKYISSIRSKAEQYGICRLVPPPSWKPPCPLKEKNIWESSTFVTRVQRVDKLQNRDSMTKVSKLQNQTRKKRRKCARMAVECGSDNGTLSETADTGFFVAENFGFEPGPEFTLSKFQKYADDFKMQYFMRKGNITDVQGQMTMCQEHWEPSVGNIEGEYWRIVEKATEEIEVLYGADLETGAFGSGFPKKCSQGGSTLNDKYIKSGWNLNNFPRLPGSVLSYESGDISGVLVPWLYIGMCFSSFCWHVEDHHLYSLNYMHWGAPKMWYGVPGKDASKLEEAMRKRLPDLFDEQPDLLHKLVTQLSPNLLKSEGVPVYRCTQNAGEFVLTFPRAYHSGFNCGFNCAEAVNVAPVDWLPHGQIAIELYREQRRRTSISHDKLLLGAAREAVRAHWEINLLKKNSSDNLRWKQVCGKDGLLVKTLKTRIEMERLRREFLCNSLQAVKMDNDFDATSERECSICLFDLHLSAAGCRCSPDRYACLNHAKQFCKCGWGAKFFLFRYDVSELNILVEALEGKLSSIYRWARLDLGLALSSFVSKENMVDKQSHSFQGMLEKPMCPAGIYGETIFPLKDRPAEARSISKDGNTSYLSHFFLQDIKKDVSDSKLKKEEFVGCAVNLIMADRQFSQGLDVKVREEKKPSVPPHDDVILLSDDEGDEQEKPVSEVVKMTNIIESCEKPRGSGNNDTHPMLVTVTDAVMIRKDVSSLSDAQRNNSSLGSEKVKKENRQNNRTLVGSALSTESIGMVKSEIDLHQSQLRDSMKKNAEDQHQKVGIDAAASSVDNRRSNVGNPSCSQNNLDKYFRQKGPRIAKVVRRINCNVEPMEYGVVLSGKSWCNSQAIFPKGFKSRVRYISIFDPTSMAYYVSEILDAGRDGPLFMVSLENFPNELFVHVSAVRCWEMVRERVNQEISKQHKLGKKNLPPLQPPGSLDGYELFGFSSPSIVQTIEAMDRNRVCQEYWDSRPYSRPQVQMLQHSQSFNDSGSFLSLSGEKVVDEAPGSNPLPSGVDTILRGLLKKANPEELDSLCRILTDGNPAIEVALVTRLINEEMCNRNR